MKRRVLNIDEYILECELTKLKDEFNQFIQKDHLAYIAESLLSTRSTLLTSDEKLVLGVMYENNMILDIFNETLNEESLAQKWADKAAAAIETAKEKGKSALSTAQERILKIGKDIKSLVTVVVESIAKFMKAAWEYLREKVKSSYDKKKEDIIAAAKPKIDKHGVKKTSQEIDNLKTMCKAAVTWATSAFTKEAGSGLMKAANTDEKLSFVDILEKSIYIAIGDMIAEGEEIDFDTINLLNENEGGTVNIPFLSSLAKKIAEIPPFSLLHKAEHFVAEQANNGLEKLSVVLSKFMSVPGPFEFIVVGSLFGLVTGYAIKHGVTELIHEIGMNAIVASVAVLLPGIGWILGTLKIVAKGVWLVNVVETAITLASSVKKDKEKGTN